MFMQSFVEREQQDGRTRPQDEKEKKSRAEAETTVIDEYQNMTKTYWVIQFR